GLTFSGERGDRCAAVFDVELADGEIGQDAGLLGRLGDGTRGASDTGEVPAAVCSMEKVDRRFLDGEFCNAHLTVLEERHHLNANFKGIRAEKRSGAECGVVSDGDVFGDEAALE